MRVMQKVDPMIRELAAYSLNVETRALNGEPAAALIAEVDELTIALDAFLEQWFKQHRQ